MFICTRRVRNKDNNNNNNKPTVYIIHIGYNINFKADISENTNNHQDRQTGCCDFKMGMRFLLMTKKCKLIFLTNYIVEMVLKKCHWM